MRCPPLLLGVALLFWGWQTELLWLGVAAAVLLETAHVLKVRWEFTQADLDRVWNLCVALFLGATIYAFFSGDNLTAVGELFSDNSPSSRLATLNQSKRSLFQLLQWLPLLFYPIVLAQTYATQDRFALSTFSWWLRRKRHDPGFALRYPAGLNIGYPYFAGCVFAASTANQRSVWFTAGLVALSAWALWMHRGKTFHWSGWTASLGLALAFGVGVQFTMLEVQKLLQRLDEVLLARWTGGRSLDAKENQTRIGAVGRMKLSGRIVLRVSPEKGQDPPDLLREASYNVFHAPYWTSTEREFERVTPEENQATWIFAPAEQGARIITIAGALPGGGGLLALPSGVTRIEQLPAMSVATNRLGAVRVEDGPGFVQLATSYRLANPIDSPPAAEDEELPVSERATILQIARELNLASLSPEEAVRAVEEFFASHFRYSLWQGRQHQNRSDRSALSRFLLENRSGHCEYFATATTLLLRAANIPARYAAGYSVQEKKGRYWVVRERHAHAWCLAWIRGAWRDVDTTPADWSALEAQRASLWEPFRDGLSRAWFEFSKWRWGHADWKRYLLWLLVPLLGLALGRVLVQRPWARARRQPERPSDASWPGRDSEFYAIEAWLKAKGFARQPHETGSAWLGRLRESGVVPAAGLEALLATHYRLRFDPRGLSSAERMQFRQGAEAWLDQRQQR